MNDRIRFIFRGSLKPASFRAFAAHRAARLGLDIVFGSATSEACEVTVSGQGELVNAFEMALSLGPIDCLITGIARESLLAIEAVA